jgi:membrane protease YdiL (CAAX protease family)
MNEPTTARHQFPRTSGLKDALGALGEIIAILLAFRVGGLVGGLTGVLAFSTVLGALAGVAVATFFLRRHGKTWADMGLRKPESWFRSLLLSIAGIIVGILAGGLIAGPLVAALGLSPPDFSLFSDVVEGNPTNYVLFLVLVVWGSAAFGEEMLARGFILNRISAITGYNRMGTAIAIVVQAFVFSLGHLYQGAGGAIVVFAVALVFGSLYAVSKRNLVSCILMHGLVDTIAITAIYLGYADVMG